MNMVSKRSCVSKRIEINKCVRKYLQDCVVCIFVQNEILGYWVHFSSWGRNKIPRSRLIKHLGSFYEDAGSHDIKSGDVA